MNKTLIEETKLLDRLLMHEDEANEREIEPREAVEWSEARDAAHKLVISVLENAGAASPMDLGRLIGEATQTVEEDNNLNTADLGIVALATLEQITAGLRLAVMERVGEDPNGRPDLDPVEHALRYYEAHGRFPALASKKAIMGAMKKMASLPKK